MIIESFFNELGYTLQIQGKQIYIKDANMK